MNWGEHEIRFARHQQLPPGYVVIWCESDEMCRWRLGDDTYSDGTWDKWRCYRGAWHHHRAALSAAGFQVEGE